MPSKHKYPMRILVTTTEPVRKRNLEQFVETELMDRLVVPGKATRTVKVTVTSIEGDG